MIQVQRMTESARIPTKGSSFAAGWDVYADEKTVIPARSRRWVSTGIKLALDPWDVGLVWPRSGLAGKGLDTSAGVVDSDYRGEVKVLLVNGSDRDWEILPGERIAQLIVVRVSYTPMVEVDALAATARGENGFGSTGT